MTSLSDFSVPPGEMQVPMPAGLPVTIPLDQVIRQALKKLQDEKPGLIIRCEQLPAVHGDLQQLRLFFDLLFNMVREHHTSIHQLFLYIHCEETSRMPQDVSSREKHYHIRMHTNITCAQAWQQTNAATIEQCTGIVEAHKGSFQISNINNTGCLFSIILPGKLQ